MHVGKVAALKAALLTSAVRGARWHAHAHRQGGMHMHIGKVAALKAALLTSAV